MFIVTRKQIRPSINVPFFSPENCMQNSQEFKDYVYENYILTEKMLYTSKEVSESGLELVTTIVWSKREYAEGYWQDPFIVENLANLKKEYIEKNNITEEIVSAEEQ